MVMAIRCGCYACELVRGRRRLFLSALGACDDVLAAASLFALGGLCGEW